MDFKKVEQAVELYRNMKSQELFNRDETQLNQDEVTKLNQYIYDLSNPKWKPIIINGTSTVYLISNVGTLINRSTGQFIHAYDNKKGYQITRIMVGRSHHNVSMHRLVAEAFIPNPDNKPQVNHINGNKKINWVGNLEWCTCKENIQHAVANNLAYHGLGEAANSSIYSDSQIHEVCKLLETGKYLNTEIAKLTGVDSYVVSKVKCKDCWIHISKQYKIPEPVKNATGEAAAASKYTDDQIHTVCKMLQNPANKMTNISTITGVGYDMVYRIKIGKNWKHISSQYFGTGRPTRTIASLE